MPTPTVQYYKFMDGLRAIAALWVMLQHITFHYLYPSKVFFQTTGDWAYPILRMGIIGSRGVDIFFVLSGFLITGLLLEDFHGTLRLKQFYVRRFLKIVPHYILILVAGITVCVLMKLSCNLNYGSVSGYLLFLQNYTGQTRIFRHLWSMAVEMHFYLIYPLMVFFICRIANNEKDRRTILLLGIIFLIILGNIVRYQWLQTHVFTFDSRISQVSHVRFDALLFGCFLKLLEPQIFAFSSKIQRSLRMLFFTMGLLIFIGIFFSFDKTSWFDYSLAYLAAGYLILAGLLRTPLLNTFLELPLLRWLGRSSYGIYLWGYILIYPFKIMFLNSGLMPTIPVYILTTIGAGVFTTVTVEQYFLSQRKRWE